MADLLEVGQVDDPSPSVYDDPEEPTPPTIRGVSEIHRAFFRALVLERGSTERAYKRVFPTASEYKARQQGPVLRDCLPVEHLRVLDRLKAAETEILSLRAQLPADAPDHEATYRRAIERARLILDSPDSKTGDVLKAIDAVTRLTAMLSDVTPPESLTDECIAYLRTTGVVIPRSQS